jgi:hypothetical protein
MCRGGRDERDRGNRMRTTRKNHISLPRHPLRASNRRKTYIVHVPQEEQDLVVIVDPAQLARGEDKHSQGYSQGHRSDTDHSTLILRRPGRTGRHQTRHLNRDRMVQY